ncbi:MAG: type II toxin-antitoxin system RelE/ParE family toxin [Metallibacterium sp.]
MLTILTTMTYDVWFAALRDRQAQLRITARLKRVEHKATWVMRSRSGMVCARCGWISDRDSGCLTQRGLEIIVLLCGGDKTTQARDIKAAQAIAAELESE